MLFHICDWLEHNRWIIGLSRSVTLSVILSVTHYFSFFCVVGSIMIVDLRVLGVLGRRKKVAELAEELLPWMWMGLLFVILSGFLIFAGDATAFYASRVFHVKLMLLLLAIALSVITQISALRWDRSPAMPVLAKLMALVSLVLWVGVILAAVETPDPYLSPTIAQMKSGSSVQKASGYSPSLQVGRWASKTNVSAP
jgi:uncharacterized membrane protein